MKIPTDLWDLGLCSVQKLPQCTGDGVIDAVSITLLTNLANLFCNYPRDIILWLELSRC